MQPKNQSMEQQLKRVFTNIKVINFFIDVWVCWWIYNFVMLIFASSAVDLQGYTIGCIIGASMYVSLRAFAYSYNITQSKVIDYYIEQNGLQMRRLSTLDWWYTVSKPLSLMLVIPSIIFLTS